MSKAHFLRYVGRYIRRPPVAPHRLKRITDRSVEYMAKDTRNDERVRRRYSNGEFVGILKEQAPDRGRHSMRYFGLLSSRSKPSPSASQSALQRKWLNSSENLGKWPQFSDFPLKTGPEKMSRRRPMPSFVPFFSGGPTRSPVSTSPSRVGESHQTGRMPASNWTAR
jgi:Putative transposase